MSTEDTSENIPTSHRPLGYWLRVIDRRLDDRMRELFAAEGLNRRDWRRLNLIAGTVTDSRMTEKLASRPERVAPLVDRGWVAGEPGAWTLTEAGEAAHTRLLEQVSILRAEVAGPVSPDDFATTLASLEAIARTLGWNEDERMPRRHGRGFGHRRGFDHDRDSEHGHGHGHGHHDHDGDHDCDGERGHRIAHHRGGERGHGRGRPGERGQSPERDHAAGDASDAD
jgi:hypothetical protein